MKALGLILLAAIVCGCSAQADGMRRVQFTAYRIDYAGQYVYEFRLEDGTRCVAMHTTAITCEWRKP